MITELLDQLHKLEQAIQVDSKECASMGYTTRGRQARANIMELKIVVDKLRVALLERMKQKKQLNDITKDTSNYTRNTLDKYYATKEKKA